MNELPTQETLRLARQLMVTVLRAPYKRSQPELMLRKGQPGDWEGRKILPPFLGEMGFEIRYFLASVEPWLRSGWRIPARRPEYYPSGFAFADPALFADLDSILDKAGAKPLANTFDILPQSRGGIMLDGALGQQPGDTMCLDVRVVLPGAEELSYAARVAQLELELRRTFARHHIRHSRPVTPWDALLMSAFNARPEQLCGASIALAPTYKPDAFVNPTCKTYRHVGLQLRHMRHSAGRNSNIPLVIADATEAAAHLGLPLLVYGHPNGTARPEGLVCTQEVAGQDLLSFELGMLSNCELMFAPESGWCELMCWLQVPTVLEGMGRSQMYASANVFHPRVILRERLQPVVTQVEHLLSVGEMLPVAAYNPDSSDDTDWDGTWMTGLMQDFAGRS